MVRKHSRRSLPLTTTVGAVVFALAAAPAAADLYRWVDAQGVVNYSNVPPPQSVKAKRIAETEPTVSVIPPREDRAERLQAAREAALLRRIEQLEEELAALRSTPAPTVVYTYPVPAAAVTYPTSYVYPYPVYARPFGKPGRVHGFKPRHRGFGAHRGPGAAMLPSAAPPRTGLAVRARF